jgi:hypothetical protein
LLCLHKSVAAQAALGSSAALNAEPPRSALPAFTEESFQSRLPEELRVPASQKLVLQARGVGDQVYTCKAVEDKYLWTLKAPDAKLFDGDRHLVGRHFAGPTWEAGDGSMVVGKAAAKCTVARC